MTSHTLPSQFEPPMTNHEYFWHEIIEVTYKDDPCRLDSAVVTTHNNDNGLTRDWLYARKMLIDRIKSGDRFMMGDQKLTLVTVADQPYIRTDNEQIASDHVR
jgi:hypothetical protein